MSEDERAVTRGPTQYQTDVKKLRALVFQMEADNLWEAIQAKDVPPQILDFVRAQVEARRHTDDIRIALKISSPNAVSWRKIVAAFQQGARTGAGINAATLIHRHWEIGGKLEQLIQDAMENGMPAFNDAGQIIQDKDGNPVRVLGITKELSQAIDTWGRNSERYVALAVKAGLMKDIAAQKNGPGGSGQGTTIVIENHIPMPSAESIRAHQEEVKAKAKAIEAKRTDADVDP